MRVIEIFDSIDGEGVFTGCLATFIRLGGCNMRCSYCDTGYALNAKDGAEMSIDDIVCRAKLIGNTHITLTGGEPLINPDSLRLVSALCDAGFIVNIETNGSVDVTLFQNDKTVITMDYKTISSGENKKMSIDRINTLRKCDVLKIVCEESDFGDITAMLLKIKTEATVFISPVFGKIEPKILVSFAKKLRNCGLKNIRVQVQLHKIIWNPEERGV
jgi:7-carboxy-7-deazaguanine synthase